LSWFSSPPGRKTAATRDNNVHTVLNEVVGQISQPLGSTFPEAVNNGDVLALAVTGFAEALDEGTPGILGRRRCVEKADHPYRSLFRARREWPCGGCAAEQRDELATFQLIDLHSLPASQGRVAGYRIASDESAGMLEFCNQPWFCLRWRAIAC
jgi:hypothetical protein